MQPLTLGTSAQFLVLLRLNCVGPSTGGDGAGEPTVLEHTRCTKFVLGERRLVEPTCEGCRDPVASNPFDAIAFL